MNLKDSRDAQDIGIKEIKVFASLEIVNYFTNPPDHRSFRNENFHTEGSSLH